MKTEFDHINELSKEIHEANVEKGFWEDRTLIPMAMQSLNFSEGAINIIKHAFLSQQLMLTVCEITEAEEALRNDRRANLLAFDEETEGGLPFCEAFEKYIKNTFEDEIADAIIRLLDSAGGSEMNIGRHIMLKLLYNTKRPFKHGKNC